MLTSDPQDLDGAREAVRRTMRDGDRASQVIARLRALFSNKEPAFEAVDLNDAAREVVALSLGEIQNSRVILRTELADDLPRVAADRVQLQQVILNLLRNALDAMNTVDDRPRDLLIRTERGEDSSVRLSVKDAGVGFDPRTMNKLFEAFYSTKHDGMGVGLAVSRSIIENHHGRLWTDLNDGPGAMFSFSVPGRAELPT
jgi:signal transduction histidine kinase